MAPPVDIVPAVPVVVQPTNVVAVLGPVYDTMYVPLLVVTTMLPDALNPVVDATSMLVADGNDTPLLATAMVVVAFVTPEYETS